jgi:hypothetical protein
MSSNIDAEKTHRQEDKYDEDYLPKGRRGTNTG